MTQHEKNDLWVFLPPHLWKSLTSAPSLPSHLVLAQSWWGQQEGVHLKKSAVWCLGPMTSTFPPLKPPTYTTTTCSISETIGSQALTLWTPGYICPLAFNRTFPPLILFSSCQNLSGFTSIHSGLYSLPLGISYFSLHFGKLFKN